MPKIIQLVSVNNELIALCEDGTVWRYVPDMNGWTKIR